MTTLAGSVSIDGAGVATGSGMAKKLYDLFIVTPAYAAIVVNPTLGYTVAAIVAARSKLAELVNTMSAISDGPRWIVTPVKSAAYSCAPWEMVMCDPTGGAFTVTIPAPVAALSGVCVRIKNVSLSTNHITVAPSGGSLIDGSPSVIAAPAGCFEYVCDGALWWLGPAFGA